MASLINFKGAITFILRYPGSMSTLLQLHLHAPTPRCTVYVYTHALVDSPLSYTVLYQNV